MSTTTRERDIRAPKTNRAGRYRETSEFLGFVRRGLKALVRRVGDEGDIENLAQMIALQTQLDDSIIGAVAGLRRAGYSWAEIGSRTGTTRQNAQQRWGRAVAAHEAQRAAELDQTSTDTPAPAVETLTSIGA
jgi:hypothetical protein